MHVKITNKSSENNFLKTLIHPMIERRKLLGMTQEELNHKIGVADRLVSKWECGTRRPTSFNLLCWAEALNGEIVFIPNCIVTPECTIKQSCNDNTQNNILTWKDMASKTR